MRSKTKNFGIVVIGVLFLISLTGIVHLMELLRRLLTSQVLRRYCCRSILCLQVNS